MGVQKVSGKIAFVTGGASGIGAALAAKLVDEGAEAYQRHGQESRGIGTFGVP